MEDLPDEILVHIFSFLPFEFGNWFHVMLVSKRWLRGGRSAFDFSRNNNEALQWACFHSKILALEILLTHPRVDPSFQENEPIRSACMNGKLEVVEKLLQHPKVDPSDGHNQAVRMASRFGHHRIVELLLKDSRVDPCAEDNYSIRSSSSHGHFKVLGLLLKDRRSYPGDNFNEGFINACIAGHVEVVSLLLCDGRVDPRYPHYTGLIESCKNGHIGVVEILLKDPRYDDLFDHWFHFFNALSVSENAKRSAIVLLLKSALLHKLKKGYIYPFMLNTRELIELFNRERENFSVCLNEYLEVVYSIQRRNQLGTHMAVLKSKQQTQQTRTHIQSDGKREVEMLDHHQPMEISPPILNRDKMTSELNAAQLHCSSYTPSTSTQSGF